MKKYLSCELTVIVSQIASILIDALTLWMGASALSNAIPYVPEIPLPACIAALIVLYVLYSIFFRRLSGKKTDDSQSSTPDLISSLLNRLNVLLITFILNLMISFLS